MKIAERYGLDTSDKYLNRDSFIAGVECEIESLKKLDQNFANFVNVEDNSLRNNGREFISKPLIKQELTESFRHLHANIQFKKVEEAFSPRTSTHVHINCHCLELSEVKQLLYLYALFEEIFFALVANERRNNIHCVPLSETTLVQHYARPLENIVGSWHKYTALNLLPLKKQGTVEFRHLQGTGDPLLFEQWLSYLENLWNLSKTSPVNAETITSPLIIRGWFDIIFKDIPQKRMYDALLFNMIRRSVIDVKLAFV